MSAAKRTPGPWVARRDEDTWGIYGERDGIVIGYVQPSRAGFSHPIDAADAKLMAAAPDLLAAAQDAAAWMWDPDGDQVEQFERIADEYRRATGYLRPGKSEPMETGLDSNSAENVARWEAWRKERSRKALVGLRAAIAKAEGR